MREGEVEIFSKGVRGSVLKIFHLCKNFKKVREQILQILGRRAFHVRVNKDKDAADICEEQQEN